MRGEADARREAALRRARWARAAGPRDPRAPPRRRAAAARPHAPRSTAPSPRAPPVPASCPPPAPRPSAEQELRRSPRPTWVVPTGDGAQAEPPGPAARGEDRVLSSHRLPPLPDRAAPSARGSDWRLETRTVHGGAARPRSSPPRRAKPLVLRPSLHGRSAGVRPSPGRASLPVPHGPRRCLRRVSPRGGCEPHASAGGCAPPRAAQPEPCAPTAAARRPAWSPARPRSDSLCAPRPAAGGRRTESQRPARRDESERDRAPRRWPGRARSEAPLPET